MRVLVTQFSPKLLQLQIFCKLIFPMNFHALKIFFGFMDLGLKIIAILATWSKGLVTQKLLQLQLFLQICCSATLSLAITWHIVWGSIACHKGVIAIFLFVAKL